MRILFERSGGFANIRFAGDFDLDDLPADQAELLKELLAQADFPSLPDQMLGKSPVPDQFNYSVTVETESWHHTVITGDHSAPENLRPLLQKLTELTRSKGRK